MSKSLRVTLLRHGHTTSGPVYRGRVDVPLSDKGWQQMHAAVDGMQPDLVVTSPLQRCADFADQLGSHVKRDDRLLEMDFGDWDGRNRDEVWQEQEAAVRAFWSEPMTVSPPGGENLTQVQERAAAAMQEHITHALENDFQHLMLISHGGVIRCLLGHVLKMSGSGLFHLYVPYAGLAHLKVAHYKVAQSDEHDFHISLDLGYEK